MAIPSNSSIVYQKSDVSKENTSHSNQLSSSRINSTTNKSKIAPKIAPKPKRVLPKLSPQSIQSNLNLAANSNVNNNNDPFIITSKQWVLPPRPKPGRKPNDHIIKKKETPSPPATKNSSSNNLNGKSDLTNDNLNNLMNQTQTQRHMPHAMPSKTNSDENLELKLQLFNKVKENENLKKLINSIKLEMNNLNFLKNGCIDINILNKKNFREKLTINSKIYQNLDKVETINDLNLIDEDYSNFDYKDLEKILNESLTNFKSQKIDNCYKKMKINDEIDNFDFTRINIKPSTDDKIGKTDKKISTTQKTNIKNGKFFKTFTPVLTNDNDSNYIRKTTFEDCGFCSNDTPCLCLEAEIELNSVKGYLSNSKNTNTNTNISTNNDSITSTNSILIKVEDDD